MLVLSRKVGERVVIGDQVVIEVLEVNGRRIRLGIEAPPEVAVLREELSGRQESGVVSNAPIKPKSVTIRAFEIG